MQMGRISLAVITAMAFAAPAMSAGYQADLSPMPLDDETKAFIAGRGEVTAIIENGRLLVKGSFRGVPSPVTAASLWISPAIGVPGTRLVPLDVAGASEGSVSGNLAVTRTMRDALRTGRLYVQVDSEKAPPGYTWGPKGTLWGWLLPAHDRAAPGVPQQGAWFIPQLDTPSR
jgi:hypothetical protein